MLDAKKKKEREDRFYLNHPGYYSLQYQKRKDNVREKYKTGVYKIKPSHTNASKKRFRQYVKTIDDVYCRKLLRAEGFEKSDITSELIELKRQLIKLNRIINEKLQRRNSITN